MRYEANESGTAIRIYRDEKIPDEESYFIYKLEFRLDREQKSEVKLTQRREV